MVEITRGLRRELGAAEAKQMVYADPKMYPVLDTGMVQGVVEVGQRGDILPQVARARYLCCGQPFH